MRVVFNNLATLKLKSGVGQYAARLSEALAQELRPDTVTCFPESTVAGVIRGARSQKSTPSGRSAGRLRPWLHDTAKSLGQHALGALFRLRCHPGRFDLYHEPNFLPFASSLPTVITVHDLSVLLFPEWHPVDRVRRHEAQFRAATQRAAHVITVSEVIRHEAVWYLGLNPHNVTAVPNGVGPEYFRVTAEDVAAVRSRFELPANYLLYVGTIEPRKNLLTLLQAYCDLPGELRSRCPLVLAGGWGWKAEPVAEYLRDTAAHRNVHHLGYVHDDYLPGLYSGARALMFPSHYEGFGLPPLEMLATGGAVIASSAPAHREVLGTSADLIRPDDLDGWRSAIRLAITDDFWISDLRCGAREQAAKFTWSGPPKRRPKCTAEFSAQVAPLVN